MRRVRVVYDKQNTILVYHFAQCLCGVLTTNFTYKSQKTFIICNIYQFTLQNMLPETDTRAIVSHLNSKLAHHTVLPAARLVHFPVPAARHSKLAVAVVVSDLKSKIDPRPPVPAAGLLASSDTS